MKVRKKLERPDGSAFQPIISGRSGGDTAIGRIDASAFSGWHRGDTDNLWQPARSLVASIAARLP